MTYSIVLSIFVKWYGQDGFKKSPLQSQSQWWINKINPALDHLYLRDMNSDFIGPTVKQTVRRDEIIHMYRVDNFQMSSNLFKSSFIY